MAYYDPKLSFETHTYQVTFVRHCDETLVLEELKNLLAAEDFLPSDTESYPVYRGATLSAQNLVIQTLASGGDWVLLRTSPSTLLAESSAASSVSRLSLLCKQLQAPAFILIDTVFENDNGCILMEVSSDGEPFVSGFWRVRDEVPTGLFCGMQIEIKEITPQTEFMKNLINQVNSEIIAKAFNSKSQLDRPSRFESLVDELTPALVQHQNYELSRDFRKIGGKTLFFTRSKANN